jgi:hypothetical protein
MNSANLALATRRSLTLTDVPAWAWWLTALAFIAIKSWLTIGPGMTGFLGDADDAARLIEVREFMTSAPWCDTTTMTMGGSAGMLSHWSRLIDLPLAVLVGFFSLFASSERAELIVRVLWPLLVLAPVLWVLFRTTAAVYGERAGLIALALTVLCPLGLYQFAVGRIDHHNVMIAASISACLLVWAHPKSEKQWRFAGFLSGLAIAVGYEALAPVAVFSLCLALWGLCDASAARGARGFVFALALTFGLAFLATIAPARWLDVKCDAISLNLVALLAFGAAGIGVALGRGNSWSLATKLAVVTMAGGLGLGAFAALEPKCLAGPMGQLPAELKPIWLDLVDESRSIVRDALSGHFDQSLGLIAYFGLGIAAQASQLRRTRQAQDLLLLVLITVFSALACWQYKYMGYASLIAIPAVAACISRLTNMGEVSGNTIRFAATVLLSQAFLLLTSHEIDAAVGRRSRITEGARDDAQYCSKNEAIRDLADLPPGLISAHIDMGAYIPALTQHRVLSAPYHRIAGAIIANDHILNGIDERSIAKLIKDTGIDYVVLCRGLDEPALRDAALKSTLRVRLLEGNSPAYLAPVRLAKPDSVMRVWKVNAQALSLRLSAAAASKP